MFPLRASSTRGQCTSQRMEPGPGVVWRHPNLLTLCAPKCAILTLYPCCANAGTTDAIQMEGWAIYAAHLCSGALCGVNPMAAESPSFQHEPAGAVALAAECLPNVDALVTEDDT